MPANTVVPFVDLRYQHQVIEQEVFTSLTDIARRSSFILGDEVQQFEQKFAQYCEARYAVGVGSGTEALVLAMQALGIGPGDEVITAANTFVATVEAIAHTGAKPVLVDNDPVSYNLDVAQIEQSITSRTRAIIPVHLYGRPADMAPITSVARRHGLYVVEDTAQAHGACYIGRRVGALGDAGCFSFYPAKNLGAWGDAGAVVTNSEETDLRVRELRDHGGTHKYEHRRVGYTSRLDTVQAAVLLAKLRYLDGWNDERRRIAQHYQESLSEVPGVICPTADRDNAHVFHLYVIRVPATQRDTLRDHLQSKGIATGIHYPKPVHLTEAFAYLGYALGAFPVAEQCATEILSLPMYPGLALTKVDYVTQEIGQFLQRKPELIHRGTS